MNFIYPFFASFIIIFLSELGDKTQLLVLSFSTKDKTKNILLGVALGTFLSHGLAILFGSKLGSFENPILKFYLEVFTYSSFLLFGIIGFLPKKDKGDTKPQNNYKPSFLEKLSSIKLNYILIIAISILVGEFGDKTFLASLGMGTQYPNYKLSLISGAITGMVTSDSIALLFGKLIGNNLNPDFIELLSNIIFIIFGLIGFFKTLS